MINVKEARSAMKGLTGIRKELEKERSRLKGSMKRLHKHAKAGTLPDWTEEAFQLFQSKDYSYTQLLKLMRKKKVL
jgi:glutamine synthetase